MLTSLLLLVPAGPATAWRDHSTLYLDFSAFKAGEKAEFSGWVSDRTGAVYKIPEVDLTPPAGGPDAAALVRTMLQLWEFVAGREGDRVRVDGTPTEPAWKAHFEGKTPPKVTRVPKGPGWVREK